MDEWLNYIDIKASFAKSATLRGSIKPQDVIKTKGKKKKKYRIC